MKIDPKKVFLVSAIPGEGAGQLDAVSTVVVGCETHQAALTHFLTRHPGKNALSVVSLADMQSSVKLILDTVEGKNTGVEILNKEPVAA